MKVLHVTLGFPPVRTGGLTRYALDLMQVQNEMGIEACAIYAGISTLQKKMQILERPPIGGCKIFEIINSLPVPIPFVIKYPEKYMRSIDANIYGRFLDNLKPDIIHAHTIMGIHKEFFEAAKRMHIPIIYTTHDYFGLCVRTNFIDQSGKLCSRNCIEQCVLCNESAGILSIASNIMQAKLYVKFKDTLLFKHIRQYGQKILTKKEDNGKYSLKSVSSEEYYKFNNLYNYYQEIFSYIDAFHFNSTVSMEVYAKYLKQIKGQVISVVHNGITDHRKRKRKYPNTTFRIGYIGNIMPYKGIDLLLETIKLLNCHKLPKWELHLYGDDFSKKIANVSGKVYSHGKYSYQNIQAIMNDTDILVIPSICKETFGFVVLEALSYGVPVLVSSNVGAKDILKEAPINVVFKPDKQSMANIIKKFLTEIGTYDLYSEWIYSYKFPFDFKTHVKSIINYYKEILCYYGE